MPIWLVQMACWLRRWLNLEMLKRRCLCAPKEHVALQSPAKKAKPCTKPEGKWVSPVWGKLWLTQATGQSYIQFCDKGTGKKPLLVSLRANAFPNHQELPPQAGFLGVRAKAYFQGGRAAAEGTAGTGAVKEAEPVLPNNSCGPSVD